MDGLMVLPQKRQDRIVIGSGTDRKVSFNG